MLLRRSTGLWLAAVSFSTAVLGVPSIKRVGRYLYNSQDGSRFYIKGIAYQNQGQISTNVNNPFIEPSTFIDPLVDGTACARDVPYLQQLGVNTIRVYSVDNTQNHDSCMSALSSAGIYTIIDLSLPVNGSIDRLAPAWTTNLLNLYLTTVDAFSKYDNVLAYNVGNEVIISTNGTAAAAFIKAAARDVRAYLNSKSSSALVGYAAIDGAANWIDPLANYLSCDPSNANSASTAIDLFGLNDYEWCGNAPTTTYDNTNSQFAGYNVAAYFSEFGCITGGTPRPWTEVLTLFASPMTNIWSGGLAFSYFPATSSQGQFGMVTINGNTVTTSQDFTNLKTQYGLISPPNQPAQSGSGSYPSCPASNSTWAASTTLPPTPNTAACACLVNELSCRFTPPSSGNSTVISTITGTLLDTACSLLGQTGGNCNDIAADGSAGSYGRVSFCQPQQKLSYVMSVYYESQNRNAQACNFSGNATINTAAPSGGAGAAALACLTNPSATFVPSSPVSNPTATGSGTSGRPSNAMSLKGDLQSIVVALGLSAVGAIWTLMA